MLKKPKIALQVDYPGKTNRYYSLGLKLNLENERSEYTKPRKIYAVSDIEGNFQSFCKLLLAKKIINKYLQWTFEDNHLVIAGDCFDRGEQVTECLWLIYSLEEKARREGGYVHFILGNHEIMNMNGDWRYVHPKYAEKLNSTKYQPTALYDGNNELWRWLLTKNIMEKIGDILFVHGGISGELLQLNMSISEINRKVRPLYTQATNIFTDPLLSIVFNSDNSPFWYRGYYQPDASENQVNATLERFGVKTIVTGHTQVDQVTSFFNGKVINIDTNHAAGSSEALFISGDRYYRVTSEGKKERVK